MAKYFTVFKNIFQRNFCNVVIPVKTKTAQRKSARFSVKGISGNVISASRISAPLRVQTQV